MGFNDINNMMNNKYCVFLFIMFLIFYAYMSLDFSKTSYKNYNGNHDEEIVIHKIK